MNCSCIGNGSNCVSSGADECKTLIKWSIITLITLSVWLQWTHIFFPNNLLLSTFYIVNCISVGVFFFHPKFGNFFFHTFPLHYTFGCTWKRHMPCKFTIITLWSVAAAELIYLPLSTTLPTLQTIDECIIYKFAISDYEWVKYNVHINGMFKRNFRRRWIEKDRDAIMNSNRAWVSCDISGAYAWEENTPAPAE